MTGEEPQIYPDLDDLEGDQLVPDPQEEKSMVAKSAEVYYTCQVPQIILCFIAYFKWDFF